MIPLDTSASIRKLLNKHSKQPDNDLVVNSISKMIEKQSRSMDELLNNQTSLMHQMLTNQSKTRSAERKSDNKKVDDRISEIKLNLNINRNKQTYIYEKNSHRIVSALTILDLKGNGTIEEVLIKSQTKDFTIVVDIDNMAQYQRTWTELSEISEDIDGIVAVKRNGIYIAKLNNMHFKNNTKLMISATNATLDKIYVRCSYGRL